MLLLALIPRGRRGPGARDARDRVAALLALLIVYEVRRYGEARDRLRHQLGS